MGKYSATPSVGVSGGLGHRGAEFNKNCRNNNYEIMIMNLANISASPPPSPEHQRSPSCPCDRYGTRLDKCTLHQAAEDRPQRSIPSDRRILSALQMEWCR